MVFGIEALKILTMDTFGQRHEGNVVGFEEGGAARKTGMQRRRR
jgi:hypothetical protein